MPPAPAGTAQQALGAQYAYLYALVSRLNLALGQLGAEQSEVRAVQRGFAAKEELTAQQRTLRALVIKTADTVRAEMDKITAELGATYIAQSEFGSYVRQLSGYLEANPDALTQYYKFASELRAELSRVDTEFQSWQSETAAYIRTGIVDYVGELHVYGVAVGQDLSASEVDGETVIDRRSFRALFTARKLSFWQDDTEVAYISDNRLFIGGIHVLRDLHLGAWRIGTENGLTVQWGG